MTRLVIFDIDGVILDSEPLHNRAREILLKRFGVNEPVEDMVGKSNKETWEPVIKKYDIPYTQPKIERMQHEIVMQILADENIQATEGLIDLLDELEKRRITMAVASSSARWFVDHVLDYYKIKNRFFCVLTGNDVENYKPHPEIYRKSLEICGFDAKEAIAIEDSDSGQAAAIAAKIRCVGYKNPGSGNQKLDKGFVTIEKMSDFVKYID